jgi:pimeloyl-[acyl-carrier protein] methyl ester esterase
MPDCDILFAWYNYRQSWISGAMITLVLLPGMDGTGALFAPLVKALGNEFDVQVVNYPTVGPQGYPELEAIARAALPAAGPFIVLGESFSGPIAVSIAASYPGRAKGLILSCGFVRSPLQTNPILNFLVGVVPVTLVPAAIQHRLLFGRFATAALRATLAQALSVTTPATIRDRLRAVLDVNVSAKLAEIRVPVLYLQGSEDRVVSGNAARLILQLCPTAKIVPFAAPHMLLQTFPAAAARVIAEFVLAYDDVGGAA